MRKKSTGLVLLLTVFISFSSLSFDYGRSLTALRRTKTAFDYTVLNGAWLRNMRELLGLYPDELAGLLGDNIATNYVNLLEQSEEELPQEVVQKINEEIYPEYAPRVIREALDKSGLTHKQLAEYMGVNKSFIGNMIRGYYKVPIKRLEQARQLINSVPQEEISGAVILEMRLFLELSQKDFGALISGYSGSTISSMEKGITNVSSEAKAWIKKTIYPLLSTRLVTIREACKLTQNELAKILGISEGYLGLMEKGEKVVPSCIMKALREEIYPYYSSLQTEESQDEGILLLRKALDTLGITKTELAQRLDISLDYLYNMFSGSNSVSQPIQDKLYALLAEAETIQAKEGEVAPEDLGSTEEIVMPVAEKTPGEILKKIEAALADLGVGPEKLASKLDISLPFLRMMETGMVPVSSDKLEMAQRFLELSRTEIERQDALAASQETEELEVIPAEDSTADGEENDLEEETVTGEEPGTMVDTVTEIEPEKTSTDTQAPVASAETKTPAQILKDIQKQLGLEKNIDEFAKRLGTSVNILRSWTSGMVPIPEDEIERAQALLSPEDDPVRILANIQAKLRVSREDYAKMLRISYSHLTNVLNYKSAVSAEVTARAQALLAEKEAKDALRREPFYPDYIYWHWVLEETMDILGIDMAGFAGALGIKRESLLHVMEYGDAVTEEMLIKAENLLSDEQFEILKQRVGQRIADFEAEVRARHKEEGDSGG